jgi:hypothetical protein
VVDGVCCVCACACAICGGGGRRGRGGHVPISRWVSQSKSRSVDAPCQILFCCGRRVVSRRRGGRRRVDRFGSCSVNGRRQRQERGTVQAPASMVRSGSMITYGITATYPVQVGKRERLCGGESCGPASRETRRRAGDRDDRRHSDNYSLLLPRPRLLFSASPPYRLLPTLGPHSDPTSLGAFPFSP